jgi:hypothetical protein
MTQNNEDFELDYYTHILEFFQNKKCDEDSSEIWKNKTYIKLMSVLKRTQNKEMVRNAILMIISLFEQKPADFYNNQGVNSDSISPEDKKSFKKILKSEFINDYSN